MSIFFKVFYGVLKEKPGPYKLEKSSTDQMKKIWQEFSDRNQCQRKIFEASREFDFDITEEEGGPHDMSLEKADYLDKLTNMIAAKAQAEWENKMKGFEKLQEENDEIHSKIRDKEKEYDGHKDKVTEMIDNQAKVELGTGFSGPDRLANVKQANYFGWDNINIRIEKVTKHGHF